MILAYHVTISCYGFWLPNEERGSWSTFVHSYELAIFGDINPANTPRSLAGNPYDHDKKKAMQAALMYPPVILTGHQAVTIARGFQFRAEASGIPIYACAIMPDHIHLVLGRFRYKAEQMVNLLKGSATIQLNKENRHPLAEYVDSHGSTPTPFAKGLWKVFLDSPEDVRRAIRYDENNPVRAGLKPQVWDFVQPYDG